jgi:ribosomal protein S18 acetylase RimI-like enzyme
LKARSIFDKSSSEPLRIVRLTETSDEALQLLHEYYEAVHVIQRDTPEKIQSILDDRASGMWIAYLAGKAVGCVVLRDLPSIPHAGECKRLYVQPSARGHRIADKLMDALESFAGTQGLESIYLDSYHDLEAAIALYRKRGYTECERYNDNPQATIFLCKHLDKSLRRRSSGRIPAAED